MTKPYSEKTAQEIDERVHMLIENAYMRAKQILTENYDKVEQLAKLLLEREVIFTEDVQNILGPRPFPKEPEIEDVAAKQSQLEDTSDSTNTHTDEPARE